MHAVHAHRLKMETSETGKVAKAYHSSTQEAEVGGQNLRSAYAI